MEHELTQKHTLHCPYCANSQEWCVQDAIDMNSDIESMYDVLKYDQEASCETCGCLIRISEALESEVLEEYGWA